MYLTTQELYQKNRINLLFADQIYAGLLSKRYGIHTSFKHASDNREYTNLKDIHEFYLPDTPFERMTHSEINKNTHFNSLIEKYNLL